MSEGPNTPPPAQPGDQPIGGQPAGAQPPPPGGVPPQTPQAPQAPQAPQQPAAGVGLPADLMTRFLARLIDNVILAIPYMIISTIFTVGSVFSATGTGFMMRALGTVLTTALLVGYFAFMESNKGQTFGKMIMKLETRGPDGGKPTMEQALKRNAWVGLSILSIIPFVGWLLAFPAQLAAAIAIVVTINSNTTTRQGWHDNFAGGTSVIKIG